MTYIKARWLSAFLLPTWPLSAIVVTIRSSFDICILRICLFTARLLCVLCPILVHACSDSLVSFSPSFLITSDHILHMPFHNVHTRLLWTLWILLSYLGFYLVASDHCFSFCDWQSRVYPDYKTVVMSYQIHLPIFLLSVSKGSSPTSVFYQHVCHP